MQIKSFLVIYANRCIFSARPLIRMPPEYPARPGEAACRRSGFSGFSGSFRKIYQYPLQPPL